MPERSLEIQPVADDGQLKVRSGGPDMRRPLLTTAILLGAVLIPPPTRGVARRRCYAAAFGALSP